MISISLSSVIKKHRYQHHIIVIVIAILLLSTSYYCLLLHGKVLDIGWDALALGELDVVLAGLGLGH
jgi:hypothetical protein